MFVTLSTADPGHTDDQPEPCGHERHARGQQRAEGQQQHHERRDHADRGRKADAALLGLLDHLAAGGDAHAGHVHVFQRAQQRLAGGVRQQVCALVVADGREGRAPVL
jgi:hypothetical protein